MNAAKHLSQLHTCSTAAMATIANNHGCLALPLVVKVVDCIFEDSWVAPVVLRCDEDESVETLDFLTPCTSVFVCIFGVVVDL